MEEMVSAVVLAGGRATRLGGINKAMLEVEGRPIICRVMDALRPLADQILVIGHLAEGLYLPGVQVLPDPYPRAGTLVALRNGLLSARHDVSIVVGCDMPFLYTPLLRKIVQLSDGFDLAVPRIGPHLEALHAAYNRSCLPVIEDALRRRQMKIIDLYPSVRTREVPEAELRALDPDLRSFLNVNTVEDLERAVGLVRHADESSTQGEAYAADRICGGSLGLGQDDLPGEADPSP
jgi:molybdopterin-guanine dinucleotide biosynthesis protein A